MHAVAFRSRHLLSVAAAAVCCGLPALGQQNGGIVDFEPENNTFAGATALFLTPMARLGRLSLPSSDVDYFVLPVAPQGSSLLVATIPLTPSAFTPFDQPDTVCDFFNEAQMLIATNDDAGSDGPNATVSRGSVLLAEGPPGGVTYRLRVSHFNAVNSGEYILLAFVLDDAKLNALVLTTNPSFATANHIDPALFGPIVLLGGAGGPGLSQYYSVDVNAGDVLFAAAVPRTPSGPTTSPDTVLSVFGSNQTTLYAQNDNASTAAAPEGIQRSSVVRVRAAMTERVFLQVSSVSPFDTGFYYLVVAVIPRDAAPCSADLNDDGIVDAQDLSAVLGSWGVCP